MRGVVNQQRKKGIFLELGLEEIMLPHNGLYDFTSGTTTQYSQPTKKFRCNVYGSFEFSVSAYNSSGRHSIKLVRNETVVHTFPTSLNGKYTIENAKPGDEYYLIINATYKVPGEYFSSSRCTFNYFKMLSSSKNIIY